MYKKIGLFLFIAVLSFNAQARCLKTYVQGININGNEYKKNYKVSILSNGKWIDNKSGSRP